MLRSCFRHRIVSIRTLVPLLLLGWVLLGPWPAAGAAPELPPYVPDATSARVAVPDVYKWDLTPLFADDEAWEAILKEVESQLPRLRAFQGTLDEPGQLQSCLDLYFRLHDLTNHATLYANLKLNTAQSDDRLQAMQARSQKLMEDLMRTAGFIRTEVLQVPQESLAAAFSAADDPGGYGVYLENLRRRRSRVLGQEAEHILALAGDNLWAEIDLNEIVAPPERCFQGMLTDIPWPVVHDEDGREIQLTLANYPRFRASPNRRVREEAVSDFLATLRQYQHAFAAALGAQCQLDVLFARARNYDTALAAYLDKDQLDPAIYDNLVATVNADLEPLHEYVQLRRQALGIDEVHLYDLYVPMAASVEKKVPFAEARRTIMAALEPLGEEYGKLLAQGLDPRNGWLDLYPSLDKESGAFSTCVYARHPYVKMNYQNQVDDMFTLAHEYGHALHSQLSMTHQPYATFRYVPFLAEIASTCNEALLADYLLAHESDPAERAALLVERLEGIRTTIYRQTMFAEFERLVHGFVEDGRPVTAALLDETYTDLVRRYYGPEFAIGPDDGMEWAYIPHFYYKYYVYSYATGLSCGLALAGKVRTGDPQAAQAYLGMLEGGCSRPPLDLLASAGVDLRRPEAIEAALRLFRDTLAQLRVLMAGESG
jgi:oligoendopeptidase F